MPVRGTVGACSPAPGPLLTANQLLEQRATSDNVWSACVRHVVSQLCCVGHFRPLLTSARRLESLCLRGGTPHSAVGCFVAFFYSFFLFLNRGTEVNDK